MSKIKQSKPYPHASIYFPNKKYPPTSKAKIPKPPNSPKKVERLCFTTAISFVQCKLGNFKLTATPKREIAALNAAKTRIVKSMHQIGNFT